jgi:hypothetical protein
MLHRASLTHVDQLHHIGCQLSVLKRVYLAYNLIIERVLKKQEATLASLKNSRIVSGVESLASSIPGNALSGVQVPEADSLLGVSLSSAARVRFERLKDRIALYALSEIQECVDQKEALVMMVGSSFFSLDSWLWILMGGFILILRLFADPPPPLLRTSTSSPSKNHTASSA